MTVPADTLLHIVILLAVLVCVAGITIWICVLRESLRITRAVGALVIQEEEKTRRLFQR